MARRNFLFNASSVAELPARLTSQIGSRENLLFLPSVPPMDDALRQPPPVDDLIEAAKEVRIRQDLALVALGKRPADKALRVGRLFDVHTRSWREDWEIVIKGRRIAWVGPGGRILGRGRGSAFTSPTLSAVPGFGEVHKHIESSHLTPEWEAALVLPRGNTWTCEASHEFSNVNGAAQSRILAGGAKARLAAEDLPAARLRRAADGL